MKHEKPASPKTIDQRLQRREQNRQRQPWPLKEISRFDKGLHKDDRGQHPKRRI
jgi:hypothetical protein